MMTDLDLDWLKSARQRAVEDDTLAYNQSKGIPTPDFFWVGEIWGLGFTLSVDADGQVECLLAQVGGKPKDARCARFIERLGIAFDAVAGEFPARVRHGRFFVLRKGRVN